MSSLYLTQSRCLRTQGVAASSAKLPCKALIVAPGAQELQSRVVRSVGKHVACSRKQFIIEAKKTVWRAAQPVLVESGIPGISAKDAQSKLKSGWLLIDVRPEDSYDQCHAKGSKNVPLYKMATGTSPLQLLRRISLASQGVKPVEENDDFVDEVQALLGRSRGVVFCDGEGGTLTSSFSFPLGKQSRALDAAYRCIEAGLLTGKQMAHMQNGLNEWFRNGMPGEGPEEWVFESRTPAGADSSSSAKRK